MWVGGHATSGWRALGSGFLVGLFASFGCFWWLAAVGFMPMLGLVVYVAAFSAMFAVIWRPVAKLATTPMRTLGVVFLAAALWAGLEYLRGIAFTGIPMSLIGQSQTPMLMSIQIADITGVYGVSAWVALVSATVWAVVEHRKQLKLAIPSAAVTFAVVALVMVYGAYRLRGGPASLAAGPRVLLVQPNDRLDNTNLPEEAPIIQWHLGATADALAGQSEPIDFVVWSESSGPTLNDEYLLDLLNLERSASNNSAANAPLLNWLEEKIGTIRDTRRVLETMSTFGPAVLLGGGHEELQVTDEGRLRSENRRNSVYLFRDGQKSSLRYDKQHLVPFGEYIPFKDSSPPLSWAHEFFQLFNPWPPDVSPMMPGEEQTVFAVENRSGDGPAEWRLVTPICFEDLFGYRARMLVWDGGTRRADVLVNATNDGWFLGPMMDSHLQMSLFRCIETRTPMVRAGNTGVSAIIDAHGRVRDRLPASVEGTLVGRVPLGEAAPPYVYIGDLFGRLMLAVTGVVVLVEIGAAAAGKMKR